MTFFKKTHRYLPDIYDDSVDLIINDPKFININLHTIRRLTLDCINEQIKKENGTRGKANSYSEIQALPNICIGKLLCARYIFANVCSESSLNYDASTLSVYQTTGPAKGLYLPARDFIQTSALELDPSIGSSRLAAVQSYIRGHSPIKFLTTDSRLTVTDNGILNTETQELSPLSPDFVFFTKDPCSVKHLTPESYDGRPIIRQFMDEIFPQCVWDILPFTFLHGVYKGWLKERMPQEAPLGRNKFIDTLISNLTDNDLFYCTDKQEVHKAFIRMQEPEPLMTRYHIAKMLPASTIYSKPGARANMPVVTPATNCRGLLRRSTS